MANTSNHPGWRNRTYHYCRFDQKMLMEVARLHYGEEACYSWWFRGKEYAFRFKKDAEDIFVHTREGKKHRIHLRPAKLKYGWRFWFGCPGCGLRCSFLYYVPERDADYPLFCRDCIRPAYSCQNDSEIDALNRMVKKKRLQLFGNQLDVTELGKPLSSFTKPKWKRNLPYIEKLLNLKRLEEIREATWMAGALEVLVRIQKMKKR